MLDTMCRSFFVPSSVMYNTHNGKELASAQRNAISCAVMVYSCLTLNIPATLCCCLFFKKVKKVTQKEEKKEKG